MTAALLVCAMVLDAVIGEPNWLWSRLPHPAVLMGRVIGTMDARLNAGSARRFKGAVCLCLLVLLAGSVGYLITLIGPVAEVLVGAILLAQKSLVEHVRAVSAGLQTSLQDGRDAVSMIVSRDTKEMDETAVSRSAIESAAENLSDGVIAPAFWMLVGGLPALVIYKMVNTADSMIGYRTERHEAFGWASARMDDLLNLIPARLTALLIAIPSRVFDFRGIRRDAAKHRSPNAGWPEAAMSRALGIALSGPRTYNGTLVEFAWVHPDGRRDLTAADIDASIDLLWKAWAAFVLICAALAVWTM